MTTCRSCGAEIVWCLTENLERMPVDRAVDPDGNVHTVDGGPIYLNCMVRVDQGPGLLDPPDIERHVAHFATCPQADEWRA